MDGHCFQSFSTIAEPPQPTGSFDWCMFEARLSNVGIQARNPESFIDKNVVLKNQGQLAPGRFEFIFENLLNKIAFDLSGKLKSISGTDWELSNIGLLVMICWPMPRQSDFLDQDLQIHVVVLTSRGRNGITPWVERGKKPFNPRVSDTFQSERDSIQMIIDNCLLPFKAQVIFYE